MNGCIPGVTLGYAPVNDTRPALLRPRYAMKRPIPPPIAFWRLSGIDLTIDLRSFVTVMIMFITPQMNTIARASCQTNPPARHIVYVKRALRPIPGATAYGTLANKAITSVPTAAARQVATKTPCQLMPVSASIFGLTNMM